MLPLTVLSEEEAVQELRDMIDGFDLNDLAHMCSELTDYEGLRVVVRMGRVDSDAWVGGQCLADQQNT
jgi:hypothetical protein